MRRAPRTSPAVPAGVRALPLSSDLDFALRILVALILGLALGIEREFHGHPAGMRTMALSGAGACLFTAVALIPAFGKNVDPTRIAPQILAGVAFLGSAADLPLGAPAKGLLTGR